MIYLAFDSPYEAGNLVFDSPYYDDLTAITVVTDFDSGNCGTYTIDNGATLTPTITIDVRTSTKVRPWRQFLFAVENAEGKTPTFKFSRASKMGSGTAPQSTWCPLWTQDFQTWHRASSRVLTGGSTGTIDWTFDEPLPAGRVYIASHATARLADVQSYVADMLATYSGIATPTPSADAFGVIATSPLETDDIGRQVGGHPIHGLKVSWPIATTDGLRKRKLLVFGNIHAAGEAPSWVVGRYFLDFIRDSSDPIAQAMRANFDLYVYPDLLPNTMVGGSYRYTWRSTTDPNRVWDKVSTGFAEIDAIKAAVAADVGGSVDAFIVWHGYGDQTTDMMVGVDPRDYDPDTRTPAMNVVIDDAIARIGGAGWEVGGPTDTTREVAWVVRSLGAQVGLEPEYAMNGSTTLERMQLLGESWAKSIQAADAQGLFLPPIDLAGASLVAMTATGSLSTGIRLAGSAASLTQAAGALTANSGKIIPVLSFPGVVDVTATSARPKVTLEYA